jgi:hypothetical protein
MTIGTGQVIAPSDFPEAKSIVPVSDYPLVFHGANDGQDQLEISSNTNMVCGRVFFPAHITVNKLSFVVQLVSVAGTFKIAMYSEDGQTKIIDQVSATISSTGLKTISLGAPITIPRGYYYLCVVGISTVFVDLWGWTLATGGVSTTLANTVSSEPRFAGYVAVSAGTPPSTFDPTALTASDRIPLIRFDN